DIGGRRPHVGQLLLAGDVDVEILCAQDECVEVTPEIVRVRKVELDATARARSRSRAKARG
ncbi:MULTISPECIES: hypothetical protein, partial [unclassified Mycobacterium]|uniref:hypothetical protein n=1 Tax=unclassified Mycobacterium TaxID=2642494 RepID=UPI000A617C81